jgi:competence protein ComEC
MFFEIKIVLLLAFLFCVFNVVLNFIGKTDTLICVFIIFSVFLGIFASSNAVLKNDKINDDLSGETVRISGRVVSIPTDDGSRLKFYIKTSSIYYKYGNYGKNLKIYLSCSNDYSVKYGDVLELNASLYSPTFKNFDMNHLILSKGASLMGSCSEIVKKESARFPFSIVSSIRNYLLDLADARFNGDARGLFRAVTAGDKSLISSNGYGEFSSAGIAHVACISGLHISILGFAIYNLLKKINSKLGIILSIAAVFLFSVVSGASASSLRAAMMYSIFIVSHATLRQNDGFTSLAISALILSLYNPYVIFDFGFILSYLSVLGIQLFPPILRDVFSFLPKKASESVVTTLSAQMLTLPITMIYFKTISLYSVFANVIISFIFPVTLYICIAEAFVGFIPVVSYVTTAVCNLLLNMVCAVAHLFSSLPFGSEQVENIGIAMIVCYAAIVLMLLFSRKLSVYFVGVGAVVCIAVMIIFASNSNVIKYTYLNDNSVVLSLNDENVAVVSKDFNAAVSNLKESTAPKAEVLVIGSCDGEASEKIGDIISLVSSEYVYLPEGADSYYAMSVARNSGAEVRFYPTSVIENDELTEYAKTIFNKNN